MNIYSSSTFYQPISDHLPDLKGDIKAQFGKNIRRIDRFIQLSMLGAGRCIGDIALPEKTGLYMTSVNGSLSNAFSVLREIYVDKQPPMPLSFVNTVSNAACFYVAKQFGIQANNMFVTRDHFGLESALKLGWLDLMNERVEMALVGAVAQCAEPLAVHRKRLKVANDADMGEGSHWYLMAKSLDGCDPVAILHGLNEYIALDDLVTKLPSNLDGIALGFGVPVEAEQLLSAKAMQVKRWHPELAYYEFTTGYAVTELLSQPQFKGKRWCHIDANPSGQYSVVDIERC